MRILQWAFPYLPVLGGREIFIRRLSEALAGSGDQVLTIAQSTSLEAPLMEHSVENGLSIWRANLFAGSSPSNNRFLQVAQEKLERVLHDFAPDIVHFHRPEGPNLLVLESLCSHLRIPLVYTAHDGLPQHSASTHSRLEQVLNRCDAVAMVSPFIYQGLTTLFPAIAPRSHVVLNGVPESAPAVNSGAALNQVFAHGRFASEKGFQVLIAAAHILRKQGREIPMTIAGDGPMREELLQYTLSAGLQDLVSFPGWLNEDQVSASLAASRVVAMPSLWDEPFGLSAAEALMHGKPVVASNIGFLGEMIVNGKNGFVVPPNDPASLASSLLRVIDMSETDYLRMASLGRADAAENFGMSGCVSSYRGIYSQLIRVRQSDG